MTKGVTLNQHTQCLPAGETALLTVAALHFWVLRWKAWQQMRERLASMHTCNRRLEAELMVEKARQVHGSNTFRNTHCSHEAHPQCTTAPTNCVFAACVSAALVVLHDTLSLQI